ncbi:MAG TPA: hypothetical protein VFW98_03150 [Gemmatimonadaceae bacterium]|nr:hypothetical protein [Gemmatimonadaceae bacterium]
MKQSLVSRGWLPWTLLAAVFLGACSKDLPPAPHALGDLRDGVTPAESLAILSQGDSTQPGDSTTTSPTALPLTAPPSETCTITWTAPNSVAGCSAPVPTVVPAVPWLAQDGEALGGDEIEQRDPISIHFGAPVKGLTLTSTGALNCSGSLGMLIGYRNGAEVAEAPNALTDPADCGSDDVTFGVTGQFPAGDVIDSLVIVGVDPWTFPVSNLTGRALLRYTLTYQPTPDSTSVVITSVQTANQGSFTTLSSERTITMTATTVPASLADSVRWTVTDFAADEVPAVPPDSASLAQGATISWQVPKQNASRWGAFKHPGTLPQKSLAYVIGASVTDATGTTVHSTPDTVKQDEIDTMREEYIELGRATVPTRTKFGTATSTHFSATELNHADYSVYIAEPVLLTGLEALRAEMGVVLGQETALTVTSGYRNPVHHSIHEHARSHESRHQYGVAADIRITDHAVPAEMFFRLLHKEAKNPTVGACFEPEKSIRGGSLTHSLDHAHVDWRGRCPKNW